MDRVKSVDYRWYGITPHKSVYVGRNKSVLILKES